MTLEAFLAASLALLIAPGPTNTLMGLAGADAGLRRVARLIPAEIAGYLSAILPLAWLGAGLLAHWPALGSALKAAAAVWVMLLAIRLWQVRGEQSGVVTVSAARVYLTTLLNPKALVFGLVLLPPPAGPAFALHLACLIVSIAAVALIWGAAGSGWSRLLAHGGNPRRAGMQLIQRVAAVWLACVSVMLVTGLVGS